MVEIELLYPLVSAAAFSISSAMIREMDYLGTPILLNFFRTLIGAVIFLSILLFSNQIIEPFRIGFMLVVFLILSVLFNVVFGDTLYFDAQTKLGVKIATPIVNTFPFFTVLGAVIFLGETFSSSFFVSSIFVLGGVIFLSLDENIISDIEGPNASKNDKIVGLVFAFTAVLCYTLGVIFVTLGSEGFNSVVVNSVRLPAGTILLALVLFQVTKKQKRKEDSGAFKPHTINKKDVSKLLIAGTLGTFVSSLFLVLSVQEIGAGRTSVLVSTGPLFSLPLAIFWLKEKLSKFTVIGTFMTLFGLYLVLT